MNEQSATGDSQPIGEDDGIVRVMNFAAVGCWIDVVPQTQLLTLTFDFDFLQAIKQISAGKRHLRN